MPKEIIRTSQPCLSISSCRNTVKAVGPVFPSLPLLQTDPCASPSGPVWCAVPQTPGIGMCNKLLPSWQSLPCLCVSPYLIQTKSESPRISITCYWTPCNIAEPLCPVSSGVAPVAPTLVWDVLLWLLRQQRGSWGGLYSQLDHTWRLASFLFMFDGESIVLLPVKFSPMCYWAILYKGKFIVI